MEDRLSRGSGPQGERVVVIAKDDATAQLVWHDGREPTDALGWLPDLILIGWERATEDAEVAALPVETVEVAQLAMSGDIVVYLLDPLGEPWLADQAQMWDWARAGVAAMILDGLTTETLANDPVPDTPDDLD